MATKKATTQKQTPTKPPLSENLKKKWWAVLLLAIFVLAVGTFAYNKYLDHKNVQDMKALLVDFQQLEKDIETQINTRASSSLECSYGGEKFNQSRSCFITIKNPTRDKNYFRDKFTASTLSNIENCGLSQSLLDEGSVYCNIPMQVLDDSSVKELVNRIEE